MRIVDGNIFEAMRLMLPEDRELMERSRRESTRRRLPIISQDAWNEMAYILDEALHQKQPIRITLFEPHEDVIWEGIPVVKNGHLKLQTADGIRQIPLEKVIRMEK
ncbi:YolD-like family protein [Effusibacillus dendaii]|uniref:YolD-like family protein n=1 Tax=Effusibacillus dendaii TaxID=2743772 RepID=A0A7I8DFS6_9BACL|nr:YolD-like family protein [Effusibacillus dendaii]BCJ86741.1 hypothetical protein skT53_17260 [Effusibacillus dendaii]